MTGEVKRATRVLGVDAARGFAVVAMIQTHAYDGWVEPALRPGLPFQVTRFLGTLPLPLFLLLSGLSLRLRVEALAARGADVPAQRRAAIRSGLEIVLVGYALNVVYGLMDGGRGLDTWFRADVLHAIGLSLALLALAGVGRAWSLARVGWVAALLATALCPPLTRLAHEVSGPARYVLAPFVEVPVVARMPVIPLLAFCGLGAALGGWLVEVPRLGRRMLLTLAVTLAAYASFRGLAAQGVVPSRTHPIVALNVVDLAGRAALVIMACCWLTRRVAEGAAAPGRFVAALTLFGRHSLLIYAAHIPFCYGLPGRALRRALDMQLATAAVLLLIAASGLLAFVWERRAHRR
jgi:uncharacterized membrane protein